MGWRTMTVKENYYPITLAFPGGSGSKSIRLQCRRPRFDSSVGKREKEMATYSSTLAWRIPWMEEPGRLQYMGSQRVGHN